MIDIRGIAGQVKGNGGPLPGRRAAGHGACHRRGIVPACDGEDRGRGHRRIPVGDTERNANRRRFVQRQVLIGRVGRIEEELLRDRVEAHAGRQNRRDSDDPQRFNRRIHVGHVRQRIDIGECAPLVRRSHHRRHDHRGIVNPDHREDRARRRDQLAVGDAETNRICAGLALRQRLECRVGGVQTDGLRRRVVGDASRQNRLHARQGDNRTVVGIAGGGHQVDGHLGPILGRRRDGVGHDRRVVDTGDRERRRRGGRRVPVGDPVVHHDGLGFPRRERTERRVGRIDRQQIEAMMVDRRPIIDRRRRVVARGLNVADPCRQRRRQPDDGQHVAHIDIRGVGQHIDRVGDLRRRQPERGSRCLGRER